MADKGQQQLLGGPNLPAPYVKKFKHHQQCEKTMTRQSVAMEDSSNGRPVICQHPMSKNSTHQQCEET
ncbi:unnamed protein product [Staurois parvus]|uniref:Uncharacterized protein n=1 Tax=Staurois parvus TaxID=386267 RepID=A0ABN9HMB8_9NEOB|nr:unnamed protein product [Staurois parvus]